MSSKCKYEKLLCDSGWCKTATMYCTAQQEANCKHKSEYITNADRFRGMTDMQLAVWICEHLECEECPAYNITDLRTRREKCNQHITCAEGNLLNWLQQEWTEQEG